MKRIPLLLFFAFCLLAGCSKPDSKGPDDSGGNEETVDRKDDGKPYINADIPAEHNFTCPEQGTNFLILTNIPDMTASSDSSWCKAYIEKLEEERYLLVIIVDAFEPRRADNGDFVHCQPRVCTVTFKAGSAYSHTLTVRQESHVMLSTGLYGKPVLMDPAGGTIRIPIRTNCISWTPSTDAEWLSVKRIDNVTLELSSTARKDSGSARTATVTLVSDLDSWSISSRESFTVTEADAALSGDDYDYGDHIDWD